MLVCRSAKSFTLHRQIKCKCREEILSVLGTDGVATMAGRTRMPYTAATMVELQRRGSILPVNVWHETTKAHAQGKSRLYESIHHDVDMHSGTVHVAVRYVNTAADLGRIIRRETLARTYEIRPRTPSNTQRR